MQEVLRSRQPLILFLEEPSASLRLAAPARRWLLRLLRALRDGAVPDVLVVPVGIAYDVAPGGVEQDGAVRGALGVSGAPQIAGTGDQRSPKPLGSTDPLHLWEDPWGEASPRSALIPPCHVLAAPSAPGDRLVSPGSVPGPALPAPRLCPGGFLPALLLTGTAVRIPWIPPGTGRLFLGSRWGLSCLG